MCLPGVVSLSSGMTPSARLERMRHAVRALYERNRQRGTAPWCGLEYDFVCPSADRRFVPFYAALARLRLPLLSHVGYEFSLIGPGFYVDTSALTFPNRVGAALRLRRHPEVFDRLLFGTDYPLWAGRSPPPCRPPWNSARGPWRGRRAAPPAWRR